MSDEFSETDEWPVPKGWMRHEAETGLTPPPVQPCSCRGMDEAPGCDHGRPQNGTLRPNDDRIAWRDRGARIAALETENTELQADALRLDEAIGRVLALAYNARRNSGGSFTANVDVLSLERALEGSALLATSGERPPRRNVVAADTPERYTVASADRCTVHPQHVMVNQGRSESQFADLFLCECGKRAIGNTDESNARRRRDQP